MIKELLKKVPTEKMSHLDQPFADMFYYIHDVNPAMANKIKMEIYMLGAGDKLDYDMAKHLVDHMKPYGEKWTKEQTTTVGKQNGIDFTKFSECSWYYLLNDFWNKYYSVFGDNTAYYIKSAKAFLDDENITENIDLRVLKYAMM